MPAAPKTQHRQKKFPASDSPSPAGKGPGVRSDHSPSPEGRGSGDRSRNALKHGIFAREVLITSGDAAESEPEFDAFDAALRAQASPVGAIEQLLVEQLIAFTWRWRRVLRFERAAIAGEVDRAAAAAGLDESLRDPEALYGVSLHARPRDLDADLAQAEQLVTALDTPDPLARAPSLAAHALAVAERLDAPLDELLGAGSPWRQRPRFDSALVEQAIAAACDRAGLTRDAFWALVRPSVEAARDRALAEVASRDARLRSTQELAILPSDAQLDKIHRYEAHLSRQFHRALRTLQQLQAARGASPPAFATPTESPPSAEPGRQQVGAESEPQPRQPSQPTPANPCAAGAPAEAAQEPKAPGPASALNRSARRAGLRQAQHDRRRSAPRRPSAAIRNGPGD